MRWIIKTLAAPLPNSSTAPALQRGTVLRHGGLFESVAGHSSYLATRLSSYRRPCGPCEVLTPTCGLQSIVVDLAGRRQPRFSLRCQGLRHFHQIPEMSLRLDRQELNLRQSVFRTDALPIELHATYSDVHFQLLASLLSPRIQHTACRSPRGLLDQLLRPVCLLRSPRSAQPACRPRLRGSDYARYPFRYSMTSWFCQAGRHHPFPVPRPPFPDPKARRASRDTLPCTCVPSSAAPWEGDPALVAPR